MTSDSWPYEYIYHNTDWWNVIKCLFGEKGYETDHIYNNVGIIRKQYIKKQINKFLSMSSK